MCLPIMAVKTCALVISKSSRKQSYDISFKNWNYLTYGRVLLVFTEICNMFLTAFKKLERVWSALQIF